MSELSELIKINKNIESQNEEIIRLLKKIAGEAVEEPDEDKFEYVFMGEVPEEGEVICEGHSYLDVSPDVGEVYFIDEDVFKLTVKNNEAIIDNLTGEDETDNFNIPQIIANESIKRNQSISDSTVILTDSSKGKLPQTINLCVNEGAKKAYIPWNQSMELLGAPQQLQTVIKLDLYRNEEQLIEKLFKE